MNIVVQVNLNHGSRFIIFRDGFTKMLYKKKVLFIVRILVQNQP